MEWSIFIIYRCSLIYNFFSYLFPGSALFARIRFPVRCVIVRRVQSHRNYLKLKWNHGDGGWSSNFWRSWRWPPWLVPVSLTEDRWPPSKRHVHFPSSCALLQPHCHLCPTPYVVCRPPSTATATVIVPTGPTNPCIVLVSIYFTIHIYAIYIYIYIWFILGASIF